MNFYVVVSVYRFVKFETRPSSLRNSEMANWIFARKQLLELDLTEASKTIPYMQFSVFSNYSVY